MVNQRLLQDAQQLDDADKLELAQALWSAVEFDELPVTPEESAVVDQRLATRESNPEDRISSEDVWKRIKTKGTGMTANSPKEVPGTWRYVVSYSTTSSNPDVPQDGEAWEIRELYPHDDGKFSYTEPPIAPYGETADELREELLHMLAALDRPILDLTTATPALRALEGESRA